MVIVTMEKTNTNSFATAIYRMVPFVMNLIDP